MAFTVKQIDNLKPRETLYEKREGNGFGVRIYPSGTKKFFYTYLLDGRKRRINLGEYPAISLAAAHSNFNNLHNKVQKGIDPLAEQQASVTAPTVRDLTKEFIEKHSKPKKKTWREDERILNRYIDRRLGNKKAKDVTRREIKHLVDNLALTAPIQANRVLACVRKMFNYAIEAGILKHSPCSVISQPGGREHSKTRYLDDHEILTFLELLDKSTLSKTTVNGLKLILFTGQRPGEVCGMHRDEISGRWWTIPGSRTKNGKEHKVYLNDFAYDIIGESSGFILPSYTKMGDDFVASKGIHTTTLSQALRKQLTNWDMTKFTPHDLRRTCGSHLVALGFTQFLVGHILNHTDQSITSVYNQYSYDKETQQAMEAWSHHLDALINKTTLDNVIQLPSSN